MKNYKKVFTVFVISLFIYPQTTFAAWWNPLSWGVWNIFNSEISVQQPYRTIVAKTASQNTKNKKLSSSDSKETVPIKTNITPKIDQLSNAETKKEPKNIRMDDETVLFCSSINKIAIDATFSHVDITTIEDIKKLCERTLQGFENEEKIKSLKEKWNLLEKTKARESKSRLAATLDTTALKTFLASPSTEAFRTLCVATKDVIIPGVTKTAINADRTSIVEMRVFLDAVMGCELLNQGFVMSTVHAGFLFVELKESDPDNIRLQKIRHNEKMGALNNQYNFFIYDPKQPYSVSIDGFIKKNTGYPTTNFHIYVPEERAKRLVDEPGIAITLTEKPSGTGTGNYDFPF